MSFDCLPGIAVSYKAVLVSLQ